MTWPKQLLRLSRDMWPVLFIGLLFAPHIAWAQGEPVTFSTAGDYPYDSDEYLLLREHMELHNLYSPSDFFVHVGDIKRQSDPCTESHIIDVADAVKTLAVPAFVLVGDNEWTDCSDPDRAWQWYEEHLSDMDAFFCYPWEVERQAVRNENWAFVHKGVLFAGINIPNGNAGDQDRRLRDDADWIESQMQDKKSVVRAAVVFGQAGPSSSRDAFFDRFQTASDAFGKPVLYVMGDEHSWQYDNPFWPSNMRRLVLARGAREQPVEITVDMSSSNPWNFVRDPWESNPSPFDHEPCVDVGDDRSLDVSDVLSLDAIVQDDGTHTVLWTKESGPGFVSFGSVSQATTSAQFSAPGTYELRCTVNDGTTETFDELVAQVSGGSSSDIYLTINDVELDEGDGGTRGAVFEVLRSGSGSGSVSVSYATAGSTAQPGTDYVETSGTLTFSGGTSTRTITVDVKGDRDLELDEVFFVNLSAATDGAMITNPQGRGTILNDDPNVPPIATADSFSGSEDSPLVVAAPGVLLNDVDPEGYPLAASLLTPPAAGSVSLNPDGSFVYTPDPDFFGPEVFTYDAADGFGGHDTASVTIEVFPVNDPPIAVPDEYGTPFNQALLVPAPGVLDNDIDVDGDTLVASLISEPTHGTIELGADGSFSFVPSPGFLGVDAFSYRAGDGTTQTDPVIVTIGVGRRTAVAFQPTDDTYVDNSTSTHGSSELLRYRGGGSSSETYLKFDVNTEGKVTSAWLRLHVADSGTDGVLHVADNDYAGTSTPWREEDLHAGNAPRILAPIATFETQASGVRLEFDVASIVSQGGVFSFAVTGNRGKIGAFVSKEGTVPPELVVVSYAADAGPDVAVTPTSHDYGDLTVGADGSQTFQVGNAGGADLHLTSVDLVGVDATEFTLESGSGSATIAPGATHTIVVSFAPSSVGPRSASLRLATDDPDENPLDVPLQGNGVGVSTPDIAATPNAFDWGDVLIGDSASHAFELHNEGDANLSISATSVSGASASEFAIAGGGGPIQLAPGSAHTIDVLFAPLTTGAKSASLRIESDDPDENPLDLTLSGRGVEAPTGGGEILFAASAIGGSLGSGTVSSDALPSPAGGGPGDLYLVSVTSKPFRPVAQVEGLGLSWTLVQEQCGARGQTGMSVFRAVGPSLGGAVTATFESEADAAAISICRYVGVDPLRPIGAVISGNTLGFDGACDGGADQSSYSFPIETTVPGAMISSAVGLRRRTHEPGDGYVERLETVVGSGGTAAGIAVMDRIVPVPAEVSVDGTFNRTVDWSLVAVEILPGAVVDTPVVAVTPDAHDYGSVVLGTSASQTFTIRNAGGADLSVAGTSLAGLDAVEFSIESGGGSFSLVPGESRNVTVDFVPTSIGAKSATLRVTSDDPERGILDTPLAGVGVDVPVAGLEIVLEEIVGGGSTGSAIVTTTDALTAADGDLYLAAVTTKKFRSVLDVTGLGLDWSPVVSQCGGRGQTGVEIWSAQGAPTGSGPVTVSLSEAPLNAVVLVARYSGVPTIGSVVSANTMGASGPCDGGVDTDAYSLGLATGVDDAVVFSAVAMRNKSHEPGAGWSEQAELSQGTGGDTAGGAVLDGKISEAGPLAVSGTFSGTVDWAVAALELRPVEAAGAARTGPQERLGEGSSSRTVRSESALSLRARPNPFVNDITIAYAIPGPATVDLAIYDVRGRLVRSLASGHESAAVREIRWNGRDENARRVASGVYFVRLQAGSKILLRRIVLTR